MDINECTMGTHTCARPGGVCNNSEGGHSCIGIPYSGFVVSNFETGVFYGLFPHTEIPCLAQAVKTVSPGMVLVVMMLMNALKLLMNSETQ